MGIDVCSSGAPRDAECEMCRTSYFDSSIDALKDNDPISWVKPSDFKLKYRVGRGQFGDVWLSTLKSSSSEGYGNHVAVKMLPPIGKEMVDTVLRRFDSVLYTCQGLKGVSNPQGISIKNGKVCILSKLYEGSVGGKMANLPGNRLPLADVLRFAADIARGVIELHSHGIMSLNLKPCNFLLNSQDEAVVGDFGIPLLFSGYTHSELKFWLGTPNYMAPEQWNVAVRGPVSYETDSWGFGCSIVEMITGRKPWEDKSPQEIYNTVVLKGEKPYIPPGLPVAVQRILEGCFEYDYRHRPDFCDILAALTSPNSVFREGDWVYVKEDSSKSVTRIGFVKSEEIDAKTLLVQFPKKHTELHFHHSRRLTLWKDPLQVGDHVRVKQSAKRFCWHYTPHEAEGVVVEVDNEDIVVRVRFCGSQEIWEGHPEELELLSLGISTGDWVHRLTDVFGAEKQPSCVGIVHNIQHNGEVQVAFVGHETLWTGLPSGLAKVSPFCVGQLVRLSAAISPRFDWPCKQSVGRICSIMPNGCLVLAYQGQPWKKERWCADPSEVEIVQSNLTKLMEKYQAKQWAVNPMVFALGFLAGALVGNTILKSNAAAGLSRLSECKEEAVISSIEAAPLVHEVVKDVDERPEASSGSGSGSGSGWLLPVVNMFNKVVAHLSESSEGIYF